MRTLLTGFFVVAIMGALLGRAPASSTCTAWLEYADNQDACLSYVQGHTAKAGFHAQVSTDTMYYWFGTDVVGVRCIAEHGVIALFSYHHQDSPAACNLLDRIKDTMS